MLSVKGLESPPAVVAEALSGGGPRSSGGYNMTTVKYAWYDGAECWVDEGRDLSSTGSDSGAAIRIDASGNENPRITGVGVPSGGNADVFTRINPVAECGLDPSTTGYKFFFNGAGNSSDIGGKALSLDGSNTYATGTVYGGSTRLGDVVVIKYGP